MFSLSALAWSVTAHAQTVGISGAVAFPERSFDHEILFFQTEPFSPDSLRTDVFVALPYQKLSFINAGDKYVADYSVIVQVTDVTDNRLVVDRYQEHTVTEAVSMREKRVSLNQERANATQYNLILAQAREYEVRISTRDLTVNSSADTIVTIKTPSFALTPSVSSPLVYRSKRGIQVLPLIGGDISALTKDEAGFFYEVYGADSGDYTLVTAIYPEEEADEETMFVTSNFKADTRRTAVFQPFDPSELWLGSYSVTAFLVKAPVDSTRLQLSELKAVALSTSQRELHAPAQLGIPFAENKLDEAIEQLRYITMPREWDSLTLAVTRREKRQALIDFWKKRDPWPEDRENQPMQVFYKRLEYVNFHYGAMGREGWESDRGRVYLMLGPPSYIEKSPYQAYQKPFEVWEYQDLNATYYFTDQYLLGDYQLASPPPRQGVFLWERRAF